jgi:hypothetical protein
MAGLGWGAQRWLGDRDHVLRGSRRCPGRQPSAVAGLQVSWQARLEGLRWEPLLLLHERVLRVPVPVLHPLHGLQFRHIICWIGVIASMEPCVYRLKGS